MKRIVFILLFLIFLITTLFPSRIFAQTSNLPKPITGTFIQLWGGPFGTLDGSRAFFDDIKEMGMDTVITGYIGMLTNDANGCTHDPGSIPDGDGYWQWNYIDTPLAPQAVPLQYFLQAAKEKNISVYLGLTGSLIQCIHPWDGNPDDPATDQGRIIDYDKRLVNKVKAYSESQRWGWKGNFIKGFYIWDETTITSFLYEPLRFNYYVNVSKQMKAAFPDKKLMISPYATTTDTYEEMKNNLKYLVQDTQIDIIAPQDSVGSRLIKTFSQDNSRFMGMRDGVAEGNQQFGKNVELWANIETYYCVSEYCANEPSPILPPTDFKRLSWQIRAAEELVTKGITWLHQLSMMKLPFYGTETARIALRNEYLNKPIITAAFTWFTPVNFVIKGYNFGVPDQQATLYLHYSDNGGNNKTFHQTLTINNNGAPRYFLQVPVTEITGFDTSKPFELAVKNQSGYVGYYVSTNPESAYEPNFPEINKSPGDLNNDGRVDILDLHQLLGSFTSIFDYNLLMGNFGKTQ